MERVQLFKKARVLSDILTKNTDVKLIVNELYKEVWKSDRDPDYFQRRSFDVYLTKVRNYWKGEYSIVNTRASKSEERYLIVTKLQQR